MILYHYTCSHGAEGIARRGELVPSVALIADELVASAPPSARFVWLTDLAPPANRDALGLTSYTLACDRMERVYTVLRAPPAQWWMDVRKQHRELLPLELARGAMPMHWWVSAQPVPILGEWP